MSCGNGDTLSGFLDTYLLDRLDLARGTVGQMRIAVRLLGQYIQGEPTLADLTKPTLLAWMRWLTKGRAPATVNSKRRAILCLWNAAADQDLCPPPPKIAKLKEPRRIPVAWTLPEVERLFGAIDKLPGRWEGVPVACCWRLAVLLLWDSGARLDALMRARPRDVDLTHAVWHVPAEHIKGRREDREFRLHPQTVAAVAASLPSGRRLLFPFPCGRRQVWLHLKRILRSAGLPDDRKRMFHCLRRSAESYAAAERGVAWAASAIGHSVAVARKSYVSPAICQPPALVEALPRPKLSNGHDRQLRLF